MKARLSIGAITCAIMLAVVLATMGGIAKADDPGGLTCGGMVRSPSSGWYQAGAGIPWQVTDTHNCNNGKTYSVEIQYNTSGHLTTWTDVGNRDYTRNSGDCPNGCTVNYEIDQGCPSNAVDLRIKWWWSDGSVATSSDTRNRVCVQGSILQVP